jgi:hypothetical protein
MKWLILLLLAANPSYANAPTVFAKSLIRVAVIDTGKPIITDAPVCPTGHKDFSGLGIRDTHGHSGHIADVLDQHVKQKLRTSLFNANRDNSEFNKDIGYCIVFFKYYNELATGTENLIASNQALEEATRQKVDVIVYAGGGAAYDHREARAVKAALNAGIKMIAAAGNEGMDTSIHPYFPAQYDSRIQMVGNLTSSGSRGPLSNFGPRVSFWEVGTSVLAKVNGKPMYMTGTSQATAVRAGKVVRELIRSRK